MSDCIIFQGAKDKNGYGWQRKNGERKAHRAAWVEKNGPIPSGMLVCHSCDTPSCINEEHLWLGTVADNNKDKQRKGRAYSGIPYDRTGDKNPNVKLTQQDVDFIRENYKWGMGPHLAQKYNVTVMAIRRIIQNRSWKV